MLLHLSVENFILIPQLEISLHKGFTCITGETGAGKSILVGALSLILGQRADTSVLRDKSQKCYSGKSEYPKRIRRQVGRYSLSTSDT